MTVAELAKVAQGAMKVMSAYNGKVLCHRFNSERHKEIGEREVSSVWPDLQITQGAFEKCCSPILCVYADGAKECQEAFMKHNKEHDHG